MLLLRSTRRALALTVLATVSASAQSLTSPKEFFGHEIGADYVLPDYSKFSEYWTRLASQSDRMLLDTIGLTAEGRPQLMAILTSPANHRRLGRFKDIARRLALAEGVSETEARALAAEGKAVVWFDGGLHSTEVLGAQQLLETVWQLASGTDPETMRFLDDLIILAVHANPDGMQLVSDWYMRTVNPQERSTSGIPRLYQKYIGHDNNRDFYMATQPESENMNRAMYIEWFPQIMYNHHQTGPAGTVMFAPPFRDPANYNFHPLIITSLDLVGASMHNRFVSENKPGVTMRSGANYSTWWNGGLRTTAYFHNIIGLLTETIGNPTPIDIPLLPNRQLASGDLPFPIEPQRWHFRQSVDYSVTANRAVFDIASRHREQFLFNIWKMGYDEIQAGSRDSWTIWPRDIARMEAQIATDRAQPENTTGRVERAPPAPSRYMEMLKQPADRDPRAYILPADQRDFATATKLVHALQKNGITVHRATAPFTASGTRYPANSYVIHTAQAFRPHILDMFEPQDHPNDFPYPGGPPKPPYDNAGWTVAMQMGVDFDRILDVVQGPLVRLDSMAVTPAGTVARAPDGGGYVLSAAMNDAYRAVNRLLGSGETVMRVTSPVTAGGQVYPEGSFFIPPGSGTHARLETLARELGVSSGAIPRPAGATPVRPARIGLWDRYGGSMPSGWTRWILEQFEFPFQVVYPQTLDAGNLNAKYDVLIFVDGAIPSGQGRGGPGSGSPDASSVPAEFRGWLGNVTVDKTVPQLRSFLEQGGTVITIGGSTVLAHHLGLPVENHLLEHSPNGQTAELPREKYYIPGSLLEVRVDSTAPLAAGMQSRAIVMFDNSPVFRLTPSATVAGIRPVAWFDTAAPLRSGWAWGEQYLKGGVAAATAQVGRGTLHLLGPEVLFRAQPHGTFKLVFNALYEY
ncbi:MAG TPA: M14 metallopeptidase family protein [Gemmatimonadaceae bacterium]|nr:M14 metallopeptidase family protein [Gemmatimonadaceae bacterium]